MKSFISVLWYFNYLYSENTARGVLDSGLRRILFQPFEPDAACTAVGKHKRWFFCFFNRLPLGQAFFLPDVHKDLI